MKTRTYQFMAIICVLATLGCANESTDVASDNAAQFAMPEVKSAPHAGYEFETPIRIKAGDEYVKVEAPGYACPTMADVDGDGKEDLVVGQFNEGHMQFCKNIASQGESPRFEKAEWIMTGDERAVVPGVW